jgi:hypothetical protein
MRLVCSIGHTSIFVPGKLWPDFFLKGQLPLQREKEGDDHLNLPENYFLLGRVSPCLCLLATVLRVT